MSLFHKKKTDEVTEVAPSEVIEVTEQDRDTVGRNVVKMLARIHGVSEQAFQKAAFPAAVFSFQRYAITALDGKGYGAGDGAVAVAYLDAVEHRKPFLRIVCGEEFQRFRFFDVFEKA